MNETDKAESKTPVYSIISDGGQGVCWKVEYHGIKNRSEAITLAEVNRNDHGGQWIVAEDWQTRVVSTQTIAV